MLAKGNVGFAIDPPSMKNEVENSVTGLLQRHDGGDGDATHQLVGLLYGELRTLASRHMAGVECGTLQPTALVHETFLKLARRSPEWRGNDHFLAVASMAMRQLLIDHARANKTAKRGGRRNIRLDEPMDPIETGVPDVDLLLDLAQALEALRELRPILAEVFELRYFGGLTVEETVAVLEIDRRTVQRRWRSARAWLATAFDTEEPR